MFNLWIELDYFEQQVKDLLAKNKHIVDKFIEFTARDSIFNVNLLYDYIYKSKKVVLWLCRLTNLKNSKYKYFSDTL